MPNLLDQPLIPLGQFTGFGGVAHVDNRFIHRSVVMVLSSKLILLRPAGQPIDDLATVILCQRYRNFFIHVHIITQFKENVDRSAPQHIEEFRDHV